MVGRLRDARREAPGGSIGFASPKSSTFTVPSGRTLMFVGLEIAMNDSLLMRRFKRFGNLLRNGQCLVERDSDLGDPVCERQPSTSSMTSAVMPSLFSKP